MPAAKIQRKPIPKFSRVELDRANLCATALWYGINFSNGNQSHTSDAKLMANFASYFYHYHRRKKRFLPDIFVSDVRELIIACGIKMLFRGISEMDFKQGIDCLFKDVYPHFKKALKKPDQVSTIATSIKCLESLNKGLVIDPSSNRYNLASRMLFFICPNLQTFNMNNSVAIYFGLQARPHHHYADYFKLFSDGMVSNQTKLSKYKMPPSRDGLDSITWNEASRTDWWRRRVLDIAVLLHACPNVAVDPHLRVNIRRKIKMDANESL